MPTMLDDISRMEAILYFARRAYQQKRYRQANQRLYELSVVTREYDRPKKPKQKG